MWAQRPFYPVGIIGHFIARLPDFGFGTGFHDHQVMRHRIGVGKNQFHRLPCLHRKRRPVEEHSPQHDAIWREQPGRGLGAIASYARRWRSHGACPRLACASRRHTRARCLQVGGVAPPRRLRVARTRCRAARAVCRWISRRRRQAGFPRARGGRAAAAHRVLAAEASRDEGRSDSRAALLLRMNISRARLLRIS